MTTKPRETQIEDLIQRWRKKTDGYSVWDDAADELSALLREEAWQPIETLTDVDQEVLMWAPVERLYSPPLTPTMRAELKVSTRRNWTWATHWMPLPAAPKGGEE